MTSTANITVKVPQAFWSDHLDRDCVTDSYEKVLLKNHYKLTLTERDLLELLSDAHHYAMSANDYGWDMQWLVSSARATRNAIIKQVGHETLAEMWVRNGLGLLSARQMSLPVSQFTV